jgi:hypothetical protein
MEQNLFEVQYTDVEVPVLDVSNVSRRCGGRF